MRWPLVVKVGGSLLDWVDLRDRLTDYLGTRGGDRPLLIAGGGRSADVVRSLDAIHGIGQERSHRLALRSMDLTAYLLEGILPGSLVVDELGDSLEASLDGRVPILAPRRLLEEDALHPEPLAQHWDVTSDSIAARVAVRLGGAELVLLKSAPLPPGVGRARAAGLGLVDPAFPVAARSLERVSYVNLRDPRGSAALLDRDR